MKLKAYIKEYLPADKFSSQGIPLRQDEYDGEVVKHYSNPIVLNEIHGLLNDYAEKLVRSVRTTEEMAFARGAIDALQELLRRSEKRKEKVNVIK